MTTLYFKKYLNGKAGIPFLPQGKNGKSRFADTAFDVVVHNFYKHYRFLNRDLNVDFVESERIRASMFSISARMCSCSLCND